MNPRGSRTVPFVSKATGVPMAQLATRVILGEKLADLAPERRVPEYVSVKEAVLPFARFPGSDTQLGPEMKSTGEVMGVAENFPAAFGKAVAAAGAPLPTEGSVFLSVCDTDKSAATILAQRLHSLGFKIYATRGTATALTSLGIPVHVVNKVFQGEPQRRQPHRERRDRARRSTRRSAAAPAATATRSARRRCARASPASPRWPAPPRPSRRSRRRGGRACRYTACRTCTRRRRTQ